MNAKVHYSWLGSNSKKTYLLLSLQAAEVSNKSATKNVFAARLVGIVLAAWFSDIERVHVWIQIITHLLIP